MTAATWRARLASLTVGFRDSSWGNDVCDSVTFAIEGTGYTLWVEPVDRGERSTDYPDPPRFTLSRLVPHGNIQDTLDERDVASEAPILETEDPDAVIAFVRSHAK